MTRCLDQGLSDPNAGGRNKSAETASKEEMSTKRKPEQVLVTPFAYLLQATAQEKTNTPALPGRAGDCCPRCAEGILDFDGLLNLHCPRCHYVLAGCFT